MTHCASSNSTIPKNGSECGAARSRWLVLAALVPLLLASPSKAFGYADPGTGAFIYQAAYAAFLGGTFYLRKFLDVWFRSRRCSRKTEHD
jgi:hypothetical protein